MEFPDWYHDMYWSHMILIKISNTHYELCPPNQLDWMIVLTELAPGQWFVRGEKHSEEETFESVWSAADEGWVKT